MEQAIKIVAGAVCGGLVGLLMSRAVGCSARACRTRSRTALFVAVSIVGWAAFGAAVAWYLVRRGQ